jgi:2-phosphoglycolate phosphatase
VTRNHSALLLDLDGTLLDTAPDMGGALNLLLEENGCAPLAANVIRPVVSHGSARLVTLGFPTATGDEYERLRLRFLEIYALNLASGTRLFPGAGTLLAELERLGLPWGIVTNKPGWLTDPLLEALELGRRAACVVSGDTLAQRKPHPMQLLHAARAIGVPPARCVYAGDAERDIQAGRAAGMSTVVASYGYLSAEDDPLSWRPTGVVTEPMQLLEWMDVTLARAAGALQ